MFDIRVASKQVLLGTALWGWGVEKKEAFVLLDTFVQAGGDLVDVATNYPINAQAEDYGLAVRWLCEWLQNNSQSALRVLVKVGSVNNTGGADSDLTPSKMRRTIAELREALGGNLFNVSVHWDNRGGEANEEVAVEQTVRLLQAWHKEGYSVGLSGIKYPELYAQFAPELCSKWWIQVKENISTDVARVHYRRHFPNAKYVAYGINLGGLKEQPPQAGDSYQLRNLEYPIELVEQLRVFIHSRADFNPLASNFYELALLLAYCNPNLYGVIVGARNAKQLMNSLAYWQALLISEKENELPRYDALVKAIQSC